MRRLPRVDGKRAGDVAVVALFAMGLAETVLGEVEPLAVGLLGAAAMTLPLLARRRAPLAVVSVVGVAIVVQAALGIAQSERLFGLLSLWGALYCVAAWAPLRQAAIGAAVGLAAIVVAEAAAPEQTAASAEDLFFLGVFVVPPWAAGRGVYSRHQRARRLEDLAVRIEHEGEARTAAAVAGERARLARELHDVVAHAVSTIVLQASAGERSLPPDAEQARADFETIERLGRSALVDLRGLLGLLRSHQDAPLEPQPSMERIDALLEQARIGGVRPLLRVDGTPRPLPPGLDASTYRIVQEALTNIAKHAGQVDAEVHLDYRDDALVVDVRNRTSEFRPAPAPGSGLGLIGMRERVAIYGGTLDAGPLPDGGFGVHAVMPVEREPR